MHPTNMCKDILCTKVPLSCHDMLHRKFGFCYIGMTAFATDYGLDMEKAYTFAQMRQIVGRKGTSRH